MPQSEKIVSKTPPTGISMFGLRLPIKILLSLFSVCITFFFLELTVRFLPPPYAAGGGNLPPVKIFECNPELGWTGTANLQKTIELTGSYRVNLTFNSLGLHDTEHRPEKPKNTFRIVMLGDSFVHAAQVDETATTHQVLEEMLNQNKPVNSTRFEVISGGVGGWGTSQALLYYRQQWRHFQPDLVLLMFYLGNDFTDNLPGRVMTIDDFNCYAPYFSVCNGQLKPEPLVYAPGISGEQNACSPTNRFVINTFGRLYQNLRLYQQLDPLFKHSDNQLGQTYPGPYWALYIPNDDPEVEQAWQITQALLTQLNQEVEADGARFAMAFFPSDLFVEFSTLPPPARADLLQKNLGLAEFDPDRPNRRLAEFLRGQNIPFNDLTAPLINYRATGARLNLPIDGHWTVEGHRLVAETLTHWLAEQNLLTQ